MIPDERIGDYTVVARLPGGGKSQCARVRDDAGTDLFMKVFLSPRYPIDGGSDDRTTKLKAICRRFEHRHRSIMERLDATIHGGGNLVKPTAFFRKGAAFYKVSPFLDAEPSTKIATAGEDDQLIFLKTFVLCVRELHSVDIVHADLKPDNVIIQRRRAGTISRLIDFDEAYLSGNPPSQRDISGDEVFYSPELYRYANGEAEPEELTLASDVFALAIVIQRVISGAMPEAVGGSGSSCAERVLSGGRLAFDLPAHLPVDLRNLLPYMVSPDPSHRPRIEDVAAALGLPVAGAGPKVEPPSGDAPPTTRIVNTMGRRRPAT